MRDIHSNKKYIHLHSMYHWEFFIVSLFVVGNDLLYPRPFFSSKPTVDRRQ